MTTYDHDWLAAQARCGHPAPDAYALGEAYPGERDDLCRELELALDGCPHDPADRFAGMMTGAVELGTLPLLRAVVSLWRGAYRDLLDGDTHVAVAPEPRAALTADEQARLATLRDRVRRR